MGSPSQPTDSILDRDAARLHASPDGIDLSDVEVQEAETNEESVLLLSSKNGKSTIEKASPTMIFLPSHPTKQELADIIAATSNGFALTGSAAMGQIGPIIGLMDIGECDDSYLFRVSLPGVKRDEGEFSCEVDDDGKVLLRGVITTGEKTVFRYSQVFEMQTQNLCPSGRFSISFQLPGPVNAQQFSGNFGIDGILEGIVMKRRDTNNK